MIAGEQRTAFDQRITEVVAGMAGGRNRLDRPALTRNALTICHEVSDNIKITHLRSSRLRCA